jgi:sulfur transfer complex TusBCD TusB component (DsrH family)
MAALSLVYARPSTSFLMLKKDVDARGIQREDALRAFARA